MTVAAAVLATLIVVLLVFGAVAVVAFRRRELERAADGQIADASRDRLLNGLYVERVVVTMKPDKGGREEAFGGLLVDVDDGHILLRDAQAFTETGRRPVDGELLLPRAAVFYIQRP